MLNRQQLIGNIGQIKVLTSKEDHVLELLVATDDRWRDKNGNWEKQTEWHYVKMFGNKAKALHEKAKVGVKVFVEGKTKSEQISQDNGVVITRKVIYASAVSLL
jgi:single-strand DNA-binding protein